MPKIITAQAYFSQPDIALAGVIGAQLVSSDKEDAHIEDSIMLIAMAIQKLHSKRTNITSAPSICDENGRWDSGTNMWR